MNEKDLFSNPSHWIAMKDKFFVVKPVEINITKWLVLGALRFWVLYF